MGLPGLPVSGWVGMGPPYSPHVGSQGECLPAGSWGLQSVQPGATGPLEGSSGSQYSLF